MRVATIKETKTEEHRVGLTPAGVSSLAAAGHQVLVERGAGVDSGYPDAEYETAGARLLDSAAEVAANCDLLVKVKEPQPQEFDYFRPGLIIFTYLHLAPLPELTRAMLERRVIGIAYETVQLPDGSLPLLAPMSQIAGRMSAEIAAQLLKRPGPGRGKLLGGISLVEPAKCIVVGSGTVGTYAVLGLLGHAANVTVFGTDVSSLQRLYDRVGGRVVTRVSNREALAEEMASADVLIAGVLVRGQAAPKILTREMIRSMGPGAVYIDVSIDQGGISETARQTTHSDPIYVEEGVIHYAVPNMPGAVPRTATDALTASTLPYVLRLANNGLGAIKENAALARGVNTIEGQLTLEPVARAQGLPYTPLEEVLVSLKTGA
ncbi:MAG TPA: alanine dehydrogenase [Dehalococcoidia bacterium]|nr:alanine dehydrogenase [Dehalococcoidia bacterium]